MRSSRVGLGALLAALLVAVSTISTAAPGDETVIAGATRGGDGGDALLAGLRTPVGLAVEPDGDILIADLHHAGIRRLDGSSLTIDLEIGGTRPYSIARAPDGSVYWSEATFQGFGGPIVPVNGFFPANIKRRDPSGSITTIIGTGRCEAADDGTTAAGAPACPTGIAVAPDGALTFIEGHRVRGITEDGTLRTIAGTGSEGGDGDGGPATQATLRSPTAIAYDASGDLYIADTGNQRIRRVDESGTITSVAGPDLFPILKGTPGPLFDGVALARPTGLAIIGTTVYFTDHASHRVRALDTTTGVTRTVAVVESPVALLATDDDLIVSSISTYSRSGQGHQRTRAFLYHVDLPSGVTTRIAGSGNCCYAGDGGPARTAELGTVAGVARAPDGALWITDLEHDIVRRIGPDGVIRTIAGTDNERGDPPFPFDTLASLPAPGGIAPLGDPSSIAVTGQGDVFVVEAPPFSPRRLIALDPASTVVRPITSIERPTAVGAGPVAAYVADTTRPFEPVAARLYRIDPLSDPVHIAGSGSCSDVTDGTPALAAGLCSIDAIAYAPDGSVALADRTRHRVYTLSSEGTISVLAGNGSDDVSGDGGDARAAGVPSPEALGYDAAGVLYIGSRAGPVRRVTPDGRIDTVLDERVSRFAVAPDGSLFVVDDTPYLSVDHAYDVSRIRHIQGPLS